VKSLSGDGLFGAANNTTAAIQQLGGVTKLTAAEQDRATATIDKAIEKYRVLGQAAPQSMLDLSAALKSAQPPVEALGEGRGRSQGAAQERVREPGRRREVVRIEHGR
jgi:hypothetical protein